MVFLSSHHCFFLLFFFLERFFQVAYCQKHKCDHYLVFIFGMVGFVMEKKHKHVMQWVRRCFRCVYPVLGCLTQVLFIVLLAHTCDAAQVLKFCHARMRCELYSGFLTLALSSFGFCRKLGNEPVR